MDRVSYLVKFNLPLVYSYVQIEFTTFPAVFAACKPYGEDTVLAWHVAWFYGSCLLFTASLNA